LERLDGKCFSAKKVERANSGLEHFVQRKKNFGWSETSVISGTDPLYEDIEARYHAVFPYCHSPGWAAVSLLTFPLGADDVQSGGAEWRILSVPFLCVL
jgi:hypothetical protein